MSAFLLPFDLSRQAAARAPETLEPVPAELRVLVYRLKSAETRRRIASDWETFAFGASQPGPGCNATRH
jgi:hypothetical protein